jgi:hypothetical protein
MAPPTASAGLHVMFDDHATLELRVDEYEGRAFAFIGSEWGRFTLSGPPEHVAAALRELADKVDADTQTRWAVA